MSKPFRILISGSRNWSDQQTIYRALGEYAGAEHVVLLSGRCMQGADVICEAYALENDWEIEAYPADWKQFGKKAGPMRNAAMVAAGADIALIFIKDSSKGAGGCAMMAHRSGIKTVVYNEIDISQHIERCGDCPGCENAEKGIVGEFVCHSWRMYDLEQEWDVIFTKAKDEV